MELTVKSFWNKTVVRQRKVLLHKWTSLLKPKQTLHTQTETDPVGDKKNVERLVLLQRKNLMSKLVEYAPINWV
jgi:hypothetical protein